jgi:hypothetical protein
MVMKAPLRRRTGRLLGCALIACLLFAIVVGVPVVCVDPSGALAAVGVAAALAAGLTRAADEGAGTFAILFIVLAPLGLGVYALHVRFGWSETAIFWAAVAIALLVLTIFARGVIASGSADYPYDE